MKTPPSFFTPLTPLAYHVLVALLARPGLNAYWLCQQVAHDSAGAISPTTGTMHHALRRLVEQGWIGVEKEGRIAKYRLTQSGQRVYDREYRRLKRAVLVGGLAGDGFVDLSGR